MQTTDFEKTVKSANNEQLVDLLEQELHMQENFVGMDDGMDNMRQDEIEYRIDLVEREMQNRGIVVLTDEHEETEQTKDWLNQKAII